MVTPFTTASLPRLLPESRKVGLALAAMPSRCALDNGNGMAASASPTKGVPLPETGMRPLPKIRGKTPCF